MSISENSSLVDQPKQEGCIERTFTPKFILGLWTLMNFFTYYDRGAIASALPFVRRDSTIAGDGTISDAEGGAIVSAFMVGFFVTCPIFAALGGTFTAKRIITAGLVVWALACASTAVSQDYWMILISRMFVGVGEAAYAGYTVTIIDNMAPAKKRTMWIGIYYSMIAVGTASGMAAGGIISKLVAIGPIPGWRVCFATEIIPMLPIIVMNGLLPDKYNPVRRSARKDDEGEDYDGKAIAPTDENQEAFLNPEGNSTGEEEHSATIPAGSPTAVSPAEGDDFVTLPKAMKALATNLNYVLLVLGYAMYTFVLGGIAVWAISMLEQGPLHLSTIEASLFMGGATAITGLLGSVMGGVFVDKMGKGKGPGGVLACTKYLVLVMCLSFPCGALAFFSSSLPMFAVFFTVGVFLLFSVTAPVNAAMLSSVPLPLRTYGISFSVFFMHMLGDFPSPMIAGVIADKFSGGCDSLSTSTEAICTAHDNCRWVVGKKGENSTCVNIYQLRNAMLIVWCMMLIAIPCWGTVLIRVSRKIKRDKESDIRSSIHDTIQHGDNEEVRNESINASMATREAEEDNDDDDVSGGLIPADQAPKGAKF